MKSYHHFLDENYKELDNEEKVLDIQTLEEKRIGSYLAVVGDRQNAERILVPRDEWDALKKLNTTEIEGSMTYEEYTELDKDNPRVNSYRQQIKVEPEKIKDSSGNLVDNPKVKNNVFHFFYRPFRTRKYKVNYVNEKYKKDVEKN